jgi:hypothetical protein
MREGFPKYSVRVVPADTPLGEGEAQIMAVTTPECVEPAAVAVAVRRAADKDILSALGDFMSWVRVECLTEPDEKED